MSLSDWLWILGGAGLALATAAALGAWSRVELRERQTERPTPPPDEAPPFDSESPR